MTIKRYGTEKVGPGGQILPFARAVEAGGFLFVSGDIPMDKGEVIEGGIIAQTHQTMKNLICTLEEAGYGLKDVVRVGIWLDDTRDFGAFNSVFKEYFGDAPPARSCVQSMITVNCKMEIELTAYKDPA
ncbi:TdcF [Marinomonas ushuaiensis DSM 15871]|uniref:TdcF n=1 Tax=Marinomonas ushuaiensis DSM 15871 TaxID=1122207 RepID=X7E966_9GAMM|nr:RidA family protein [Marinomonas ushuaiensis]ETX12639.1 TdcF [Marinomonas ushuaiensis DSM 15871]